MPLSQITVRQWGMEFHFASLDGDHFLPVNRLSNGSEEDEKALAALFEGDGNFKPMTFGRLWFNHQSEDAEVVIHA